MKRTHHCAQLSHADLDATVSLLGWVDTIRDQGGIIFIDLRDRKGVTQIKLEPHDNAQLAGQLKHLKTESVIGISGKVVRRPAGTENKTLPTGEVEVVAILAKVDALGGTIKAIEEGFFQREIADSAYDFARRKAAGEQPVIGVNTLVEPSEPPPIPIHKVDPAVEARQVARLGETRRRRDQALVDRLLDHLEREARETATNLMPVTIQLVRARASLGEIAARLRRVWGSYVERPVF